MKVGFSVGTLVKVLVFILVSVVMTVALAMEIANLSFRDLLGKTYGLEAEFENASGVFEGDAVKLAGVDIGRVTGTEIEDGKAVVSFTLDRDVELRDTTRMGIRWRNVIGLRFLYVYPGEGGEPLQDGDRIPVDQTDSAGDIGELLNNLGPILKAIDPEQANAFLDAMNTALAGNEEIVRGLLTQGATLAGDLGDLDEEIQTLITSSDEILAAYAGQDDDLGRIIDDLDVLGGRLAEMTDTVNSLVSNFAVVQDELDRLLRENRENIDVDIRYLNTVLGNLATNRNRLERVLCSLPPGVLPYDRTSSWGEWFNVRIVQFVVKDPKGDIIGFFPEDPELQRPEQGPPTIDCPRGIATAVDPRNRDPDQEPPQGPVAPPQDRATLPLRTWLDAVVGRSDG